MEMENVGDLVPSKAHKSRVISEKKTARLSQSSIFKGEMLEVPLDESFKQEILKRYRRVPNIPPTVCVPL
jgi:hypothetical protein